MAEEDKVVAAESLLAVVPAVAVEALLNDYKDDDWEVNSDAGLDRIGRVVVNCNLRELREKCRATKRKVPTSMARVFTLAIDLLGSVEAYSLTKKRTYLLDQRQEPKVRFENRGIQRDENCKAVADVEEYEFREGHACKLDKVRDLCKLRKSKRLQERHKYVVD